VGLGWVVAAYSSVIGPVPLRSLDFTYVRARTPLIIVRKT
jgi:hypothetical protein